MQRSPISHRALRLVIAFAVLVLVAGLGARAARAASDASTKSCADQVIADWYDDGKVSKIYPLQCYRDAIKKLPPDVRDYSNAREEIARALAFAAQGKPDPGNSASTDSTATTTSSTGTHDTTTEKTTTTKTTKTNTTRTSDTAKTDTAKLDTATPDTSGPSSVPVPLLVLGGLAVLLLAAGSAGYLRRRMNGGDGDGMPPTEPPAPPIA